MDNQVVTPVLKVNGWEYEVSDGTLLASCAGRVRARLPLAPILDGKPTAIESWSEVEKRHFVGALTSGDTVHLAIDCGHACFGMETKTKQFETVTYFPGSTFSGPSWHSYTSDEHDRSWDANLDQEVGISSSYDDLMNPFIADGAGMTDPGDNPPYFVFNVPPRAFSWLTDGGYLGFSMPGALPVGVVRMTMNRKQFSLGFDLVRPGCSCGSMPRVYFVTGFNDPYDVLDEHRIISDNLGLTVSKKDPHPRWWTNAEFYYWDEFTRLERLNPESAAKREIVTVENLRNWLSTVKNDIGLTEMNMPMEQGCYELYGDYRATAAMGGVEGFRKLVDEFRDEGTHIGFYIHPYMCNSKVEFYKQHPEAFCKPREAGHKTSYALEYDTDVPEFHLLDWTHPLTREYMTFQIKRILSDEPGCMNCDILRSNHWRSPDPRVYDFHDPDWGVGDLMTYRVQKLIYETAKRIKSDCMVTKIGIADPYMQPWADVSFLCEEWNGYTDNWYRRGRIGTRTISDLIFYTDSWFITITKGYEYYMGMLAWNLPSTESIRHTIHPYIYHRELQEKDFKRRKSGFQTALHSPLKLGDPCRVDILPGGKVIQWRKNGTGPLKGFYAAIGIDKKTLVTFTETEARVGTSISRTVEFPLPPGANVSRAEMTPHEGAAQAWEYELVTTAEGPGVRMHIEDCGKQALYYSVYYNI